MLNGRYSKNGESNLDLFLMAHAGDSVRVDRGSREPVYLDNSALTLGLSPQPSVLQRLPKKEILNERGLLPRFFYLLPQSNIGYCELKTTPVPGRY